VLEFLREKRDSAGYVFKLRENEENLGFPAGCNIGAAMADDNNDILFLNNDAVISQNALFWLRMGLYDNRNVGAVGAITNCAVGQQLSPAHFEEAAGRELPEYWHRELGLSRSLEIFDEVAGKNISLSEGVLVRRFKLVGFALLASRKALEIVAPDGKVFDERFFPGYFEDDDLSLRIALAGFEQYLCMNAFIYHNGGGGFSGHNDAMEKNRERFREKWGFDSWEYNSPFEEAVEIIAEKFGDSGRHLRVLDLACGFGATASRIKQLFPEYYVAGVCKNSFAAAIARHMADAVTFGDPNLCNLPWKDKSFDVVIGEKENVSSGRVLQCLAPGGIYINEEGVTDL
jgi:hypothetical protein